MQVRVRLDSLLVQVADGDHDAFADLYTTLRPRVIQVAAAVVRDPAFAEDASQEVFDWVWREAARFDPGRGSAQAWILTIAKRRAVDLVRREDAWRRRQRADFEGDFDSTWEEVLAADLGRDLSVGMHSLTHLQRTAITMTYGNDLGYPEVACSLGINYSTLKSRVHSGILQLRRQLV